MGLARLGSGLRAINRWMDEYRNEEAVAVSVLEGKKSFQEFPSLKS